MLSMFGSRDGAAAPRERTNLRIYEDTMFAPPAGAWGRVARKLLRASRIRSRIGNVLMFGGRGPVCLGRKLRMLPVQAGATIAAGLRGRGFGSDRLTRAIKDH